MGGILDWRRRLQADARKIIRYSAPVCRCAGTQGISGASRIRWPQAAHSATYSEAPIASLSMYWPPRAVEHFPGCETRSPHQVRTVLGLMESFWATILLLAPQTDPAQHIPLALRQKRVRRRERRPRCRPRLVQERADGLAASVGVPRRPRRRPARPRRRPAPMHRATDVRSAAPPGLPRPRGCVLRQECPRPWLPGSNPNRPAVRRHSQERFPPSPARRPSCRSRRAQGPDKAPGARAPRPNPAASRLHPRSCWAPRRGPCRESARRDTPFAGKPRVRQKLEPCRVPRRAAPPGASSLPSSMAGFKVDDMGQDFQ